MARTAFSGKKPSKGKKPAMPVKEAQPRGKKSLSIKKPVIAQPPTPKARARPRSNLVLREIAYYQQSTQFLTAKRPFVVMIRNLMGETSRGSEYDGMRFTAQSLTVLQEAYEAHLTSLVEAAYHCTRHGKRVTLYTKDLRLVETIKGKSF
jgi:histone H3